MANILEDWSGDWRCEAALTKANVGLVHTARETQGATCSY